MSTVIISGATSGVGLHTAVSLAAAGYDIIATYRDDAGKRRLQTALSGIPSACVHFAHCDFSRLRSVAEAAEQIRNLPIGDVRALVLNAGTYSSGRFSRSADRVEETLAVNVLGQFMLFRELEWMLPRDARVITLASQAHRIRSGWLGASGPSILPPSQLFASDPCDSRLLFRWMHSPSMRYATSKLYCVQLAYEINRRTTFSGYAVDPGIVASTKICRNYPRVLRGAYWAASPVMEKLGTALSPQQAGDDLAWVAVSDEAEGLAGEYIYRRKARVSSPESYNLELSGEVWKTCMRLTENRVSAPTRGRQRNS